MNETIEQFKKHANSASFHFADDSGKEWAQGYKEQGLALKLFDENPDLQTEMRVAAKDQLWSLETARPLNKQDEH